MIRRTIAAFACSLALVGSLTACATQPTTTATTVQPEAEANVCAKLADVQTAAAGVKALDQNSTFDEVEQARETLTAAIADLRGSRAELQEADMTALESARDAIQQAVKDVSGSDTIGEAATALKSSATQLETAVNEMRDGAECNGAATSTP